jgi:hypothetical protein
LSAVVDGEDGMVGLARSLAFLGLISLLPIQLVADEPARSATVLRSNPKENSLGLLAQAAARRPQSESRLADSYDALLHSRSLADQREALTQILDAPQKYIPRIQQSLRDYPRLLRSDPKAASRAVYLSALLRDPSFPPILVKSLGLPDVLDDCEYACPVVFALTIQACFAGWSLPKDLDSQLTTVYDLQAQIQRVPRISLQVGSIEDQVQGPVPEKHRKEIEGKTEEQIIQMAGPTNPSIEARVIAAFRLETLVTSSKNRIDLYLLALNDFEDGSGEYKGAVYQSIYRAELAKLRGQ